MSEFSAKSLRDKMRSKISRLVRHDDSAVDASGYKTPAPMNTGVKTGARPLSRRLYKRGGKVIMVSGEHEKKHAGRKARKSGGKALTADSFVNRNVREANEERDGIKHVGAFKKGGRTYKADGGFTEDNTNGQYGKEKLGRMNKELSKRMSKYGKDHPNYSDMLKHHSEKIMDEDHKYRRGGRAHKMDGGSFVPTNRMAFSAVGRGKPFGMKKGGHAHPDEAEDKALIKKVVKSSALKGHGDECRCAKCSGGRAGKAGGGYADGGKTKWIQKAIKHPGSLHKALHVAKGEKIPEKKLAKATHSKNPHVAKKARLAETLKRFHKADGGGFDGPLITPTGSDARDVGRPMVSSDKLVPFVPTAKRIPPRTPFKPSEADLNEARAPAVKARKRGGKVSVSDGALEGTRPTGGRLARKTGGRASKGKMNVNIIIGAGPKGPAGPGGMGPADGGMGAPVGMRQGLNPPMPPPGPAGAPPAPPMGPGAMPPGGMPPGAPPMMGRKSGGRVSYPLKDGAGGGLGRLQKIKAYGDEAYDTES